MCEEMSRTTRVIFDYTLYSPGGEEITATITNSSGDYGYGPELDKLRIVHRTDAYESVLYEDCLVDESFDLEEVKTKTDNFAKEIFGEGWNYWVLPF